MAIYEFFCPKCRVVFEVNRPMSQSDEPAYCPKCGTLGGKLPSVFSSTADSSVKGPDKSAFRGDLKTENPSPAKPIAKTSKTTRRVSGHSLSQSTTDNRHYQKDRTSGTVNFGDGQHGGKPPAGGKVSVNYRSGAGKRGNVSKKPKPKKSSKS